MQRNPRNHKQLAMLAPSIGRGERRKERGARGGSRVRAGSIDPHDCLNQNDPGQEWP
jgi:hypothetical protein